MDIFSKYIVKEGRKKVLISFLLMIFALFFISSYFLKLLFFLLFLFFLYIYFNNQTKNQFLEKNAIYAPIDGKVVEKIEKEDRKSVRIYSSLLENSVIKSPIDGKIEKVYTMHGAFLKLNSSKSGHLNERFEFILKNEKIDIKVSAITDNLGFFGFNIYKQPGLKTETFENIGFASNALFEITLPKNVELKADIGEQLASGISILGYIKEEVE